MAKADLRVVQRWLQANPGYGLSATDVPGLTESERNALASLGRLAGSLLHSFEPDTKDPARLLKFCSGNQTVADWFEGRAAPEPPAEVHDAARRMLLDDGEDGLARLYAALVSPARRRRLGTFFTPKLEVTRMISSWNKQNVIPKSVIDVGAGVGIYTVASAYEWPDTEVFAVDVNPVTLGLLALRAASVPEELHVRLVLADFAQWATETWDELPSPRLVLGNPPYTRMQLLPEDVREDLVAKAGGLLGRRASLASLLTVISLRLLGPQDGLCLLLPAQWLESDYADGMREWLWHATDRRVELRLFSQSLFKDAAVDAVSLLVGPSHSYVQDMTVALDDNGFEASITRSGDCPSRWRHFFDSATTSADASTIDGQTTKPADADGTSSMRKTPKTSKRQLGDIATVRRGIATGSNSYFVLSEDERRFWNLPTSALTPVVRRLRGANAVRQTEWLHDPHPSTTDPDRTVAEVSWLLLTGDQPVDDHVSAYLQHGLTLDIHKSVLAGQRPDWYDLTPLTRTVDVAISPMSKGVFRALPVPPRTAILNNLYGLCWNEDLADSTRDEALEYLGSPEGQARIQQLARSQASGLFKIEPRALTQLELP